FGQRFRKLLGEGITKQDQVVEALMRCRSCSGSKRRKITAGRDMEVQEIARCVELRTELLGWRADIQRAGRHDTVKDGVTASGQLDTGRLQGDGEEISVDGRRSFFVRYA